jgi:hypothetical protein
LKKSLKWEDPKMSGKLFLQAIAKFLLGVVLVGALIFLPAGTFAFPGGWLLMGILFVPMFAAGLIMMAKNPGLLKSRLKAKETQQDQDLVHLQVSESAVPLPVQDQKVQPPQDHHPRQESHRHQGDNLHLIRLDSHLHHQRQNPAPLHPVPREQEEASMAPERLQTNGQNVRLP